MGAGIAQVAAQAGHVVRLLDNLEQAGLAERREEAGDRRAKTIHLTAAGEATVEKVERVSREVRARLLDEIADRDLQVATRVLQRIAAALESLDEAFA